MFDRDDDTAAAARAEMLTEGAARYRTLEHEALGMLDRANLTAVERQGHMLMVHMARVFARAMEINDPVLPRMLRHFAKDETGTGRTGQA